MEKENKKLILVFFLIMFIIFPLVSAFDYQVEYNSGISCEANSVSCGLKGIEQCNSDGTDLNLLAPCEYGCVTDFSGYGHLDKDSIGKTGVRCKADSKDSAGSPPWRKNMVLTWILFLGLFILQLIFFIINYKRSK